MSDDVSRLDPDELRAWRNFLEGGRLISVLLDRRLKQEAGITHADYGVLVEIAAAGRLRMAELAHQVWFSRSRLAHLIDRLVRLGLVVREEDPVRGKTTYAVLTEKGERAVAVGRSVVVGTLRVDFLAHLPTEGVSVLGPGLDRAVEHLRDLPDCAV
ncbi:MarR family winged helix-turn-helix transcriptional regulator [Rhizohabitans arisaemae]|uniref:MarR family winged helix-turn-helix transcriptional regulator n=1 Tax=Rhizohabitans arisaemae TaxID=2720610 RepID=UPI0024B24347|nr:MarR family winged helix-turn-helix transcriptional regulator [Rhizohabitans arisaemae]